MELDIQNLMKDIEIYEQALEDVQNALAAAEQELEIALEAEYSE